MDITWWAFVGVVLVAYLVPGPDFIVIMRAATRGTRTGIAAAVVPLSLTDRSAFGQALGAWAAVVLVGLRLARVLQSAVVRRWWDRTTGLLLGGVGGTMVVPAK